MNHPRTLDEVAYVRFASVYRSFRDIDQFMVELGKLVKAKAPSRSGTSMSAKPPSPDPELDAAMMRLAIEEAHKAMPSPNPRSAQWC